MWALKLLLNEDCVVRGRGETPTLSLEIPSFSFFFFEKFRIDDPESSCSGEGVYGTVRAIATITRSPEVRGQNSRELNLE